MVKEIDFGAGNTKRILKVCPSIKTVVLQDPLMPEFHAQGKASTKMPGMWSGGKLETFQWAFKFDTMVCINVMDHVQNVADCFRTMDNHLYRGGMLIIGQDLTSEFDMVNCPEMRNDPMHPIKISMESIAPFIFKPDRWNKWECVRDEKAEDRVHSFWCETLQLSDVIFVHDDGSRGMSLNLLKAKHGAPSWVIKPTPSVTPILFHWRKVIEQCDEIHCIASSFAAFIDSIPLPKNPKLFLHAYARPGEPLMKVNKQWEILT